MTVNEEEEPIQPVPHTSPPYINGATEERKPLSRKLKLLTAIAIFYGNVTLGCSLNTYGPVITSLQTKYDTDDATISKVFTILTVCYMFGALAAGFIYNYINRQMTVIALLTTQAAIMFLTPYCPTMTSFFVSAGVMGFSVGLFDVAQFVWMMEMMQKDCPPYVQAQHFSYALGTSLSGLIMAPFLDKHKKDDHTSTTMTSYLYGMDYHFPNDSLIYAHEYESSTPSSETDSSKLFIPFSIIGFIVLVAVLIQTLLFIFLRYRPPPPEVFEDPSSKVLQPKEEQLGEREPLKIRNSMGDWSWPKVRMVMLSCCFYGAYQGMEMCTFQFFPKFGQNSDLKLSESESSYVLSGMTVTFAVGRALAIIAVFKISCQLILCFNIVAVIIANIILVGWASHSLPALWVCSILFGIGFSSQYGSFSAYMERYLEFTNTVGAMMIVCGSGVAAIYPLVVGSFIEENPIVLSYIVFFSIFFLILSIGSLSYLTYKDKTRH